MEVEEKKAWCDCKCCNYWRRHIHKVAAKADSKVGVLKSKICFTEKDRDYYKTEAKRLVKTYTALWNTTYKLRKASMKQRLLAVFFPPKF